MDSPAIEHQPAEEKYLEVNREEGEVDLEVDSPVDLEVDNEEIGEVTKTEGIGEVAIGEGGEKTFEFSLSLPSLGGDFSITIAVYAIPNGHEEAGKPSELSANITVIDPLKRLHSENFTDNSMLRRMGSLEKLKTGIQTLLEGLENIVNKKEDDTIVIKCGYITGGVVFGLEEVDNEEKEEEEANISVGEMLDIRAELMKRYSQLARVPSHGSSFVFDVAFKQKFLSEHFFFELPVQNQHDLVHRLMVLNKERKDESDRLRVELQEHKAKHYDNVGKLVDKTLKLKVETLKLKAETVRLKAATVRLQTELKENNAEISNLKAAFEDHLSNPSGFSISKILDDQTLTLRLNAFLSNIPSRGRYLLYRASYNGDSPATFHALCDNKGPTVTIVKANGQIFGGYTPISWDSRRGTLQIQHVCLISHKTSDLTLGRIIQDVFMELHGVVQFLEEDMI